MNTFTIIGCAIALQLAACTSAPPDPHVDDTPTAGDILILADEDFRAIITSQQFSFESIYANAHVRLRYLPQAELLQQMMNDSVRVVFSSCLPGGEQEAYFRTRRLKVDEVPVLTDGIAILRSANAPAENITLEQLRAALTVGSSMTVLFDGTLTGVARTLMDSLFGGNASLMKNAVAVPGTDSLVAQLRRDPTTVGLVSFARISDLDDPACRALREGLVLAPVGNGGAGVVPSQSTLADGSYPLRRTLYALLTEGKSGLGTGFVSFVAGHKGQRIILKSGLAPIRVPARNVEIVH